MPSVAESIRDHHDEIMDRWLLEANKAASARGLSAPELQNLMPKFLASLSEGAANSAELSGSHLSARIREGFDLAEIVNEFSLLASCVASVWTGLKPEQRPPEREREQLSAAVQRSIVLITGLFQEHMQLDEQREKRYLRLLQTLADESLRAFAAPLQERLREVLELIMEAMDARSAAILLYEPQTERLIMEATAGAAERELKDFATSLAVSSFAGKIASREQPTSIANAETTELEVSEELRHSGIHSLLGTRLSPRHTLQGVMYIGLGEERPFSPRELRRLEVLAERLALHLDNARLYTELRERIAELRTEQTIRDKFVAILAHDLRGPLSNAKMGAQLLLQDGEQSGDRRDIAARIDRNLERIDRMIRDLLDVNRVQAGERLPLRLDRCDLGAVAEEAVEELRIKHGDRFELVSDDAVRGIWSGDELRRAIWNLAVNAVKYGEAQRPITLRAEHTPDGARLSVHNHGPVIRPEDQELIFDAFSRLHSQKTYSGWGLGLALVRACAQAHGGEVKVQSSADGTTFTIELPRDSRPYQQGARSEEAGRARGFEGPPSPSGSPAGARELQDPVA